MTIAEQLITKYDLKPHPEGGWYTQTYKSNEQIAANALPGRFGASRVFSTAIYFLLEKGNFSAFHRIKSDECWHFYSGDPLLIYIIDQFGEAKIIALGNDFEYQSFQYVVPANCWFACMPSPQSEYCLVGCTVAPGFEFDDFELADVNALIKMYPQHERLIRMFSR
jgi:predicted cupin superfamily sugar epimerase